MTYSPVYTVCTVCWFERHIELHATVCCCACEALLPPCTVTPAGECGGVTSTSPAYDVSLVGGANVWSELDALQKAFPLTCSVPLSQASWAQRSTASPLWTAWDSHRTPTSKSCRTGTQPMPWTSTLGTCLRQTRRDSTSSGRNPTEIFKLCKMQYN